MRALEAKSRRIGGFLLGDVLACGFAESGGGLFHVEDVIRDLEGPAYRFAEVAEARKVSLGGPGTDRTGSDWGTDERSGFSAGDIFERFPTHALAFTFPIPNLAAAHAVDGCRRGCNFAEDLYAKRGADRCCANRFKSQRQESIACEDGDRFTELLVASRLSAAEVVVIERGKIVMNERVSMDQL